MNNSPLNDKIKENNKREGGKMNLDEIRELEKLFTNIPRAQLGFFPTPLYKVENISKDLGIELYLKRDDITGPSVFGGNKIRKLEFLLGDAMKKKATYVMTHGATQSNHAMETVTACNKMGLKTILYLVAVVPPVEGDYRSNLLLDKVLGADINIINLEDGMTEEDGEKLGSKLAEEKIEELKTKGICAYDIPVGGSTPVGALGFTRGYLEYERQLAEMEMADMDHMFITAGSGGTMAGILAGKSLLNSKTNITGVAVSPKDDSYKDKVAYLANESLKMLGVNSIVERNEVNIDTNYVGEGYEIPTKAASEAIKYFARREGIILDPVYTGKAMSGLLDYVKSGKVPQGSKVVFWHTGGGTALFAEEKMVGKIFD